MIKSVETKNGIIYEEGLYIQATERLFVPLGEYDEHSEYALDILDVDQRITTITDTGTMFKPADCDFWSGETPIYFITRILSFERGA